MNRFPAFPVLFALIMSCIMSCRKEQQEQIEVAFNPDSSYTLKKTDVNALVSDSGITRYKVTTQTLLIFEKAKDPYWFFPDGVYLERYDTVFNIEASIKADTAYRYVRRRLWKFEGHVDISNSKGERFQTSQMFLDENSNSVYSEMYIRVTKKVKGDVFINEGTGFRSNIDISVYDIFHPSAEIPVEMKRRALGDETLPADSLPTAADTIP
jgi:LPS export ABC transporter protein LptC